MLNLIRQAYAFSSNLAIVSNDRSYSYQELLTGSQEFASVLLGGSNDLEEKRIGFLVDPGFEYVKVQWAIWQAGGIAVPLNTKAPAASHQYVIADAAIDQLVCSEHYADELRALVSDQDISLVFPYENSGMDNTLPEVAAHRRAMILYTSGTTGSPKGVVTTHANIEAQIIALVSAWKWSSEDRIINVLPLHHVHGIINVLCCALWSGATCEFMAFEEAALLDRLASKEVNVFMAVPTIYFKLIARWETYDKDKQEEISSGLQEMRLMVSGSAALPVSVLEKWKKMSGHTLLERYGMTEIGMAISNSYEGERIPGHIGEPLPGVQTKLVDEMMNPVLPGEQGEILVKGPSVFYEYWRQSKATQEAFTEDGWFKTGDVAIISDGYFKIIGRSSIDIIKSGGYKLSALEIEEVLRTYDDVKDCGVVGIPDEEWGEVVAVGLVTQKSFDESSLRAWMKTRLPNYKIPKIMKVIEDLPRNAMGKVVKNELKEELKKK